MKIKKIILLNGDMEEKKIQLKMEVSDVVVILENGRKYISSFFTYGSINRFKIENKVSGEFLGGSFFWSKNMLLTRSLEIGVVTKIVEKLIEEGDFDNAFEHINLNNSHEN